jgi:hypothetical protein
MAQFTLYRIQIAAQAAEDANKKPYESYVIPEPKSFMEYQAGLKKLALVPRSEIGTNAEIQPPEIYKPLTLKRGGQPIEIVVCKEQLTLMKTDRKNLLIFGETEVSDEPVQEKPTIRAKAG